MRSEHQKRVDKFMAAAGQELPDKPAVPSLEVRLLRARLRLEETMEFVEACGLRLKVALDGKFSLGRVDGEMVLTVMEAANAFEVEEDPQREPDLVKMVDGCLDGRVIDTGSLSAFGVDDEEAQKAVDEANLRKFTPPDCPACGTTLKYIPSKEERPDLPDAELLPDAGRWACWVCGKVLPKEAGPYRREDGKWCKPADFKGPEEDLRRILFGDQAKD